MSRTPLSHGTAEVRRFAVIGDIHHCLDRPGYACPPGGAVVDDTPRYTWMRDNLLPVLIAELRAHDPDVVLCTGDISEGCRDSDLAEAEYVAALDVFSRSGLTVLDALGTHEPRVVHLRVGVPRFAEFIGQNLETAWFSFDTAGARFVVLDYLDLAPGGVQARWFEERVMTAPAHAFIFVFGHAPFANFARPFFSHAPMQRVFETVFARRSPTVYFCGHTHNQALTRHRRTGGMFLQIKCSSVGSPALPADPLEAVRVLLLEKDDRFYWGTLEDRLPGYWICDFTGDNSLRAQWFGVGRGRVAEVLISASGAAPEVLSTPEFSAAQLTVHDLPMIQDVTLELAMAGDVHGDFECVLNGAALGCLPPNTGLAARRGLPLSQPAITALRPINVLEIRPGKSRSWLAEGARLVARTLDGRRLCSPIPKKILAAGEYAERAGGRPLVQVVSGDRTAVFSIDLPDSGTDMHSNF